MQASNNDSTFVIVNVIPFKASPLACVCVRHNIDFRNFYHIPILTDKFGFQSIFIRISFNPVMLTKFVAIHNRPI